MFKIKDISVYISLTLAWVYQWLWNLVQKTINSWMLLSLSLTSPSIFLPFPFFAVVHFHILPFVPPLDLALPFPSILPIPFPHLSICFLPYFPISLLPFSFPPLSYSFLARSRVNMACYRFYSELWISDASMFQFSCVTTVYTIILSPSGALWTFH